MTTRTYRIDHDLGFAPNPFFGWCSLACCMPQIRRHARIDDVIIGMAGSGKRGLNRIHPQVIYWMRVSEAMCFDEYWNDPRFAAKQPQIPGPKLRMVGDRTYRRDTEASSWLFDLSMHYLPPASQGNGGHVVRDTKVDRLLVGRDFTYWGKVGPKLPDHLLELFPSRRGQKCPEAGPLLAELHEFVGLDDPQGVVGDPADWDNARYFPLG